MIIRSRRDDVTEKSAHMYELWVSVATCVHVYVHDVYFNVTCYSELFKFRVVC